jgi:hypothetical protein
MAPTPPQPEKTGMLLDFGRPARVAPAIVVLTSAQPSLHRLASTKRRGGLTADRVLLLRHRIASGYYETTFVVDAIARRIRTVLDT